jgi:uncharacterized protein (TIGR03067 family)
MNGKRWFVRLAPVIGLLAIGGVAVWYFVLREPEARNDLERFQGEWQISREGKETPNAVRVNGDTWEYVGGKAYRMTLDESANPKQIDLELIDTTGLRGAAVKMHGVYVFDGNKTIRVRINPASEPRPTTLDDPDATVWVLTRVKLERNPEPGK